LYRNLNNLKNRCINKNRYFYNLWNGNNFLNNSRYCNNFLNNFLYNLYSRYFDYFLYYFISEYLYYFWYYFLYVYWDWLLYLYWYMFNISNDNRFFNNKLDRCKMLDKEGYLSINNDKFLFQGS
jgi:hypothetical protein